MDSMRQVLRKSLARSLHALPEMDRLAAAWPVACGKTMASRGKIVGFEAGVIRVAVEDGLWLTQMLSMRGALERDLARIAGVAVSGIHFKLAGQRGSRR